jgi:hypothetical protein
MDAQTSEMTIKAFLTEKGSRLEKAPSIAEAAEVCALSGKVEKGIKVALDIEGMPAIACKAVLFQMPIAA